MKPAHMVPLIVAAILAANSLALAADSPSELLVGKWQTRLAKNAPEDSLIETFEFNADGKGRVYKTKDGEPGERCVTQVRWEVEATSGKAVILKMSLIDSPAKVKPAMLLRLEFDGDDAIVFSSAPGRRLVMDRTKAP